MVLLKSVLLLLLESDKLVDVVDTRESSSLSGTSTFVNSGVKFVSLV